MGTSKMIGKLEKKSVELLVSNEANPVIAGVNRK